MAFLQSKDIKVFPCGGRNTIHDPLARLTTEYNLISIINRLVDKDGFIISVYNQGTDISVKTDDYIININGYLFTIVGGAKSIIDECDDNNVQGKKYIIAKISPHSYEDVNGYTYIQLGRCEEVPGEYSEGILDSSSEDDSTFYGISFELSDNAILGTNQLTLFEYDVNAGHWIEYEDSKIKFSTNTNGNRSITIDDGVI